MWDQLTLKVSVISLKRIHTPLVKSGSLSQTDIRVLHQGSLAASMEYLK